MPNVVGITASGIQEIDGTLFLFLKWNEPTLTYSFPTTAESYTYTGPKATFNAWSNTQKTAGRLAIIENYARIIPTAYSEIAETGILRMADTNFYGSASSSQPANSETAGDCWFPNGGYETPTVGGIGYATAVLHELGHTHALHHGHQTQGEFKPDVLPSNVDGQEYSIMTYRAHVGGTTNPNQAETWGWAQTLMMLDVQALQYLYGAKFDESTDITYHWNPTTAAFSRNGVVKWTPGGNRVFMNIWHQGGVGTYDFSSYTAIGDEFISLAPGAWSLISSAQRALLRKPPAAAFYAPGNISNSKLYGSDTRSVVTRVKPPANDGNSIPITFYSGRNDNRLILPGDYADYTFVGADRDWVITETATSGDYDCTNLDYVQFADTLVAAPDLEDNPEEGPLLQARILIN